jgi:hypothetical protein
MITGPQECAPALQAHEPRKADIGVQAVLLAPGSIYSPRLPTLQKAVAMAGFVPGYSGGTAPDSHRILY